MVNKKNNRLGRGISELIRDSSIIDIEDDTQYNNMASNSETIPISLLYPSKFQPRETFDEEALSELAKSITTNGIIQPILVRKRSEAPGYEVIAGERRWRASIMAHLKEVPVIIKDLTDKQCLELSIIENIQRQDLNPIEEAEAYKKLANQFSYKHEELAAMMGKSRSHITNMIRILSLPNSVKDLVKKKVLSFGHARALINVENPEVIAKKIAAKALSVRQTESLIKKHESSFSNKKKSQKNDNLSALEKNLSEKLGLSIKIEEINNTGKVTLHFKNLQQLDLILQKLNN